MKTKMTIQLATFALSLAFVLGNVANTFAQVTTNGNGGSTDVGTWYEALYTLVPPGPYNLWNGNGSYLNNLPLVNWSMVSGSPSYRSGKYQIYDSSNSTVIADDC